MQVNVNPQQQPQQPRPMSDMNQQYSKRSRGPWIVLVVVVLIVLAGLAYAFRDKFMSTSAKDLSGYQAVFLTNGQVYFGKLSHAESPYVRLTDIYYLQVNQQLQPTGATGATAAAAAQAQPQLSLVKLGNELHGPTDQMEINSSQVLFYEDLKADGKVAQAIVAYKASQAAAPAATTPAATAPAATPAPVPAPTK